MQKNNNHTMRVTLIGVASTRNCGQMAMVEVCLREIIKMYPQATFVLHTYDAQADRNRLTNYPVRVLPTRFSTYSGMRFILPRLLYRYWRDLLASRKLTRKATSLGIDDGFIESYVNADVIIDLSGDSITDDYSPVVTCHQLLWLLLGTKLNKPTLIMAQSLGPFYKLWGLTRKLAKKVFSELTLTTVRESITYDYLRDLGVAEEKFCLTSDLAFLLRPAGKEKLAEILRKEKWPEARGLILGVTPSPTIGRFTEFCPNVNERQDIIRQKLADLLSQLATKFDLNVVFIPHVSKPGNDDKDEAREIVKKVTNAHIDTFRVIKGDYTATEIKAVIGQCDLFIGFRMHPTISSLSQGIPTLSVAYSHKTHGIIGGNFGENFVVDIRKKSADEFFDLLSQRFEEMYRHRDVLRKEIVGCLAKAQTMAKRNFELLQQILEQKI